jgi:hypothetical protein
VRGFEWDALRVGDPVLVHDDLSTLEDFPLCGGTVATVDGLSRPHGVSIRLTVATSPARAIVRPLPMQVHRDPRDPAEPCWRCQWETRVMVETTTKRETA